MENKYFSLDEKPEKGFVSILMVVFGFLCLGTSAWWAIFLLKTPEQAGTFWIATMFLFLFGIYQVYAGLGFARRYMKIDASKIILRQNSFFAAKTFYAQSISSITLRSSDVKFSYDTNKTYKLKLGIRYPDLGENIKKEIIAYAETNKIELLYKYDIAD